jgi:hypothetical protein
MVQVPAAGAATVASPHRGPRFVLLSDQSSRRSRSSEQERAERVWWRLYAANNRPIGGSISPLDSVADCLADAARLHLKIDDAVALVQFQPRSAQSSHWSWNLLLEDVPVASSVYPYKRRVECARSLRSFIDAIRVTEPATEVVLKLGPRLPQQRA